MNHIDARAALDNQYLMKLIETRMEDALYEITGASNEDDKSRFSGAIKRRLLQSILDELAEACKVKATS